MLVASALAGGGLPGLVLLPVGAVVAWQVAHTAHTAVLHTDGTLVVHRPRGPLRTRLDAVTAVRPSGLWSSHTRRSSSRPTAGRTRSTTSGPERRW
ncbi:hypothetical protein [Pseudonocardia abyssalis]|uniref:Uncharacterized protein n=1 Tax=Pseudonocardia abyssalis TaxID=2792008 RepID=A0ABS6UUI5_9PSEU|nr:hypothetical protein [Pseudonocardia abyssalis]MBW0135891.1 hypothetical protein [Pseudonocardia abyssalis]